MHILHPYIRARLAKYICTVSTVVSYTRTDLLDFFDIHLHINHVCQRPFSACVWWLSAKSTVSRATDTAYATLRIRAPGRHRRCPLLTAPVPLYSALLFTRSTRYRILSSHPSIATQHGGHADRPACARRKHSKSDDCSRSRAVLHAVSAHHVSSLWLALESRPPHLSKVQRKRLQKGSRMSRQALSSAQRAFRCCPSHLQALPARLVQKSRRLRLCPHF